MRADSWLRIKLTVVGLRTVHELRGINCIPLEEQEDQKSILVSRTLSTAIKDLQTLKQAIATYATKVADKLRKKGLVAHALGVFVRTNRFQKEAYYGNEACITLPYGTSDTRVLVNAAYEGLEKIYKEGKAFTRVGVLLLGLIRAEEMRQPSLFTKSIIKDDEKSIRLMKAMDSLNTHYGKNTVRLADLHQQEKWSPKREKCTPHYTTSWEDIVTVKV